MSDEVNLQDYEQLKQTAAHLRAHKGFLRDEIEVRDRAEAAIAGEQKLINGYESTIAALVKKLGLDSI